jgi:hypothetical protein
MSASKLITRKELAQITGLTIDEIRANEERIGLKDARWNINRNVRYNRAKAMRALKRSGFEETD